MTQPNLVFRSGASPADKVRHSSKDRREIAALRPNIDALYPRTDIPGGHSEGNQSLYMLNILREVAAATIPSQTCPLGGGKLDSKFLEGCPQNRALLPENLHHP